VAQQFQVVHSKEVMVAASWLEDRDYQSGQGCRLHVAFHGCLQYRQLVGDAYYANAGYNRWAATNRIIVLYPPTVASPLDPFNPNGCWDWWGYTDSDFDTRSGRQIVRSPE
jgi:poly(3-hydroxybutyrate) depolymerase